MPKGMGYPAGSKHGSMKMGGGKGKGHSYPKGKVGTLKGIKGTTKKGAMG